MVNQLKTCIVDIVGNIDIVDIVGKIDIVGIGTSRLPEHFNPKHSRAAAEAANLNDYYYFLLWTNVQLNDNGGRHDVMLLPTNVKKACKILTTYIS